MGTCKKCHHWSKNPKEKCNPDERRLGQCCLFPPLICQTLVPAVIRENGLVNIKEKQERFQMRPITENNDTCGQWAKRSKK